MNKLTKHFLLVYLTVIILAVVPALWAQETSETAPEATVESTVEVPTEPAVEVTIEPSAEAEVTVEPTAIIEITTEPTLEPTIEAPPAPTDEPPVITPPTDSFADHFDNGDAWVLLGWQVIDGVLTTSEANASATLLGVDWPHLLFSATVQIPSGSAVSIVLRSSGENYTISLESSGRATLVRSGALLAESASVGETDAWRTIQIQALGGLITAAVDSVVQFSYDDSPGLGAGAIGFLSGGPAAIDNVSIIRLDAPPVVVIPTEEPTVEPTAEPTLEITEVAAPPAVDEPPVITGLAASYDAQAGEMLALTFSVSDDADLVAVIANTDSSAGKVALAAVSSSASPFNTNVSIQYFPADDFSGLDQFTIIATDAGGNVVSADVQVNVAEPPDSNLTPLIAYSFDDEELADFVLRPGWAVLDGTLQASNTPESADILTAFGDGAIHARLLLGSGSFNLAFRQQWQDMTATGYTAAFRASGEVALYRSGALLASAPAAIAGQWRAIHVLADGGDLSIEIDGVVALNVTDPDPLPAGEISFTTPDTIAADENSAPSVVQMDDVEIWAEAPAAPTLVPGGPLPAPPGIANIGDRVWLDNNGNGLQDSGEPGVANVRLNIFRYISASSSVYVTSTWTNAIGHYQFAVPSGYNYFLTIEVPQGYILTNPNIGSSAANSDFNPITFRMTTSYTYLSSTEDDFTWDAGLISLSICQENSAIDIMLVLDGSSSITAANFTLMKNFASGLVQSFNVGTNTARFGVVQFSTSGRGRLETGLSTSQSAVLSRIYNMVQINGLTDIAEGLRFGQDEMGRNGRNVRQVPRAIVLLTDGYHNESALSELTRQVNRAKNAKSLVYGIAVGSGVNMAQINQIASDPDSRFVFSVSSFAGLVQALRSVAANTCYTPVLPYLPPPVLSPLHNSYTNDNTPTFNWGSIPFTSYLFGGFFRIEVDNNTSFASPEYAVTISGLSTTTIRLPDGRYYCRIRAGNILGLGPWSRVFQIVIDTVPPPTPVLSAPADGATSTNAHQSLTWRAAPGAKLYDIQIATNTSFTTLVYNQRGLTRASFAPPTSLRQGVYYWRVRAVDAAGNIGAWSLQRRLNINILKSPADNAYIVSSTSAARPTFAIAAVPGAVRYQINIANSFDFSSSMLYAAAFTGTSYKMPANFPLSYGLYHWRVNVDMGSGFVASPFSRILVITPPAPPRPSLSSPANTVALNSPRPSLFWNAITYNYAGVSAYYQVQVDNNSNFASPERVFNTYGLQYNIATNLLDGTYYWRVRAINNLGYPGPYSSARRFTIDTVPPSQAALNTPANGAFVSATRPPLKWFAAAGASQYRVQIDNNSNFSSPEVDAFPVSATSFTPPAALPQGLYYWRVRAVDAAGNLAPWSAARSLNISIGLRPAHGTFIVSKTNAARPTFTWASVRGAVGYQLTLASTPSFGASTFYAVPLTTTSHTLPAIHSLTYGTYYWRINLDLGSGFVGAPYYQQLTITP